MCVCMRNGIQIWIEQDKIQILTDILAQATSSKFIVFENQVINTADILGVFDAKTISDLTRRKNGQWQCARGEWHERNGDCGCHMEELRELYDEQKKIIDDCKECDESGVIPTSDNKIAYHSCHKEISEKIDNFKDDKGYL